MVAVSVPITSLYAGCLGLVYVAMTIRVASFRFANKISIGEGNNKAMAKFIRGHGNFGEYTPLFLVLLALMEMQSFVSPFILHAYGFGFTVGRLAHGYNFFLRGPHIFRVLGTSSTITCLIFASFSILTHGFKFAF